MGKLKSFDIRRLVPFRKRDAAVPETSAAGENLADLDPNLRPEDEGYVKHYLGYADRLLEHQDEQNGDGHKKAEVFEMPKFEEPDEDGKDKAA